LSSVAVAFGSIRKTVFSALFNLDTIRYAGLLEFKARRRPKYKMFKLSNWAVVGDVLNSSKPAYRIVSKLKSAEKTVFLIDPKATATDDKKSHVHKTIGDIKDRIDVVNLVVNPKLGIDVVKEARLKGITNIFIQPGAESEQIEIFCKENKMNVYKGCVLTDMTADNSIDSKL